MAAARRAAYLGISLSTTTVGLLVRSRKGDEEYVAHPMLGRTAVLGEPAFTHDELPLVLLHCLVTLEQRGWTFHNQNGCLAIAVRQHDLTLADDRLRPLLPALTWESNAASVEADALNADPQVTAEVGPVAARMLTPKAQWLLARRPELRDRLRWVLTTADWIGARLTGEPRFGSSDGLSNAQLRQSDKAPARKTLAKAGLAPRWQPPVVKSGEVAGTVDSERATGVWTTVARLLHGWRVGAPLGDNHAGAWGMSVAGPGRVVLSAGSSGTAVGVCPRGALAKVGAVLPPDRPPPLQFEFFDETLLLTMLPRCCVAWDAFRATLPADLRDDFGRINQLAERVPLDAPLPLWKSAGAKEKLPREWAAADVGRQIAGAQFSVAVGLLQYASDLVKVLRAARVEPTEFVLTGGLGQSPLFQQVVLAGLELLAPGRSLSVSARTGPDRFQAAARGALMAAMLPDHGGELSGIARKMDCVQPCPQGAPERLAALGARLKKLLPAE